MSDLEDYAYSPYDDLEDILYDADPNPELADDLAEHALHSPVYLDEIAGYELEEYHSDWEYYSDDYMDDDPTLENKELVEKEPSKKRGKKRKLVEINDIPALDLNETKLITRSIKGTVWAKPRSTEPPTHNVGQGDQISLMKDWRQVFSIKDDGWGRRTDADDNDESWAKDLGLADMGLRPQRQMSFEQGPVQEEDEYDEEGSVLEDEDEDLDMDEDVEDLHPVAIMGSDSQLEDNGSIKNSEANGSGGVNETRKLSSRTRRSGLGQEADATTINTSEDENPRKRRRVKPGLNSALKAPKSGSVPGSQESPELADGQRVNASPKTRSAGDDGWRATKKRKASEEPYSEHDHDTVSADSHNVKRVAAGSTNGSTTANETGARRSRRMRGSTKS